MKDPFTYKQLGNKWDREHFSPSYQAFLGDAALGVISRTGGRWDDGPHTYFLRGHDDQFDNGNRYQSRRAAAEALRAFQNIQGPTTNQPETP
jgi:hypothetical protein